MKTINNNIEEIRVGLSNAKLLKEKGFEVLGKYCYDCLGDIYSVKLENHNKHTKKFTAPTQQLTIDWILENHHLHLVILPTVTGYFTFKWIDVQLDPENVIERPPYKNVDSGDYNIVTEAKEAAITYVLTNLLK